MCIIRMHKDHNYTHVKEHYTEEVYACITITYSHKILLFPYSIQLNIILKPLQDLMNRVLRDMPEEPMVYLLRTLYKKAGMEIPEVNSLNGLRFTQNWSKWDLFIIIKKIYV